MELNIWQGDWDLPSVDLHCLQVASYVKFSGAPVKFKPVSTPFWVSGRKLPVISDTKSNSFFNTFDDISAMLRKQGFNPDYILNPKEMGLISAYHEYLKIKLYPAFIYIWWVDNDNYIELSRPWYAKALQLPFNYFYPGHYQRNSFKYLKALYPNEDLDCEESRQCLEVMLYKNAQECISHLSEKLGKREYFLTNSPCSLDAIIFGYLGIIMQTPFKNAALQNHLKGFPNLVEYVSKILRKYFPSYKNPCERPNVLINEDLCTDEFPHQKRNKFIAALIGSSAVILYALYNGLLKFEGHSRISKHNSFYEVEEDQESSLFDHED